jgi:two-component system, response regulator PdtaR
MISAQMRILVVENHQLMAVGLKWLLTRLGHNVVDVVGTGEEAVIAAEQHRPDFIFMDVGLDGEMDGVIAAQEIRNRFAIRSLFLTGLSDPATRERAALAEPFAFLDKTASKEDLARVINGIGAELRGSPLTGEAAASWAA